MRKNNVERGRAQTKTWRTRIATLKPKATNTHSETQYLLLFQNDNGWMNAPQCYVVLYYLSCSELVFKNCVYFGRGDFGYSEVS